MTNKSMCGLQTVVLRQNSKAADNKRFAARLADGKTIGCCTTIN